MSTPIGPGALADPLKAKEAPVLFQTLNEIPFGEAVTMLAYGGSGVGKTMFCATAGPRTLFINIGDGITTIQSPVVRARDFKDGFPIVATIREERDPETGLFKTARAFDQVCDAIDYGLAKFPEKFDTIVIDDATALRAFAVNKGLELNEDFQRSKTLENSRKFGGIVMAVQDFAAEMNLIAQFIDGTISLCKGAGKHLIMTAHERYVFKKIKDQAGKVIGEEIDKVRPAFTGKTFPDEILAPWDLVWNLNVARTTQGGVYRAWTEDAMTIRAKSRYPGVFKPLESNINFLEIVARIKKASVQK